MNENFEMEEMRQQMAILKQKLHQQEILNDRMTSKAKTALGKDMSTMDKRDIRGGIILLLAAPLLYYSLVCQSGFSMALGIYTSLLCLIGSGFAFWYKINANNQLLEEDLVEAQRRVSLAKKRYMLSLVVGYILGIAFIIWLFWEIYQKAPTQNVIIFAITFAIVMPFGVKRVMMRYRSYRKMLDQIADLTEEKSVVDN